MVRVVIPYHLRTLARTGDEVQLDVSGPATQQSVLDAMEARYPMLRGTIRDHGTLKRRPFIRFFACEKDLSHDPPDTPLPEAVATGREPFLIVGAIAGGVFRRGPGGAKISCVVRQCFVINDRDATAWPVTPSGIPRYNRLFHAWPARS